MFTERPGSPRIFESDFLDWFTRVHWSAVPVVHVPIATGCVVYALLSLGQAPPLVALLVLAGVAAWTFSEYWLHRTLFHWEPDTRWGPTMHFFLHGVHHTWPNDQYRLVMPPWVSLGLLALVWPACLLLLGDWGWAFVAGVVAGYVNYDLTHYYIHHARPVSRRMKRLRAHHMNHHHNKEDRKFGVSTTFWDQVFGTT